MVSENSEMVEKALSRDCMIEERSNWWFRGETAVLLRLKPVFTQNYDSSVSYKAGVWNVKLAWCHLEIWTRVWAHTHIHRSPSGCSASVRRCHSSLYLRTHTFLFTPLHLFIRFMFFAIICFCSMDTLHQKSFPQIVRRLFSEYNHISVTLVTVFERKQNSAQLGQRVKTFHHSPEKHPDLLSSSKVSLTNVACLSSLNNQLCC